MGPAVGLGLGRFAYALLLPAMRLDLGWSYAAAGAMNTANAVGYLIGALAAAPIAAQFGDKRGFVLGLLLATASLFATGLSSDYAVLAGIARGGRSGRGAVADHRRRVGRCRRRRWRQGTAHAGAGRVFRRRRFRHGGLGIRGAGVGGRGRLAHRMVRPRRARHGSDCRGTAGSGARSGCRGT